MTTTADSKQAVNDSLEADEKWPQSEGYDTVNNNVWPLAWDSAAFIDEWFSHPDHNDLEEALCHIPLDPQKFGYDVAEWHSQKPPEAILRAHLLRIVKGWEWETALCDYLKDRPELVEALGFNDGAASKTTLWRAWNSNRLSDEHKEVLRTIGQVLVNVARDHDVPAPEEVFCPDPGVDAPGDVEQDNGTVRDRTIANTRKVWKRAKPMITGNFGLPRGVNSEIHENAFWECHAYAGSRAEMYAENGTDNFAADTTRDRVQTGSTHRHHIQKIMPDEARKMHRETTKELIERARRDSELVDGVIASIDITKSNPYRENTALEFDEDGLANRWLLGYKDSDDDPDALPDIYFQWASIQIVGMDIPLILDALPVYRGLPRQEIVDRLLEKATEMVDIELLLMDREFAHSGVKDVCEDHGIFYLNPGKMHASERAQCTRLRRQGKLVHIEEDTSGSQPGTESDSPTRKVVYVPAMKNGQTSDSAESDDETDTQDETDSGNELKAELVEEFSDVVEEDIETVDGMFDDVIEEIREEERERDLPGNEEDTNLYMLFETNHPDLEVPSDGEQELSESEKVHMVSRMVRKYNHRWGIENGFKKVKQFRVRTTSMKYHYRFFNFLYACTLYNAWRLVDILVKLELNAMTRYQYKPLVTADLFLTIAKDYCGLDPPD